MDANGRPWDVSSMLVVCFIELKIKVNVMGHGIIGLHYQSEIDVYTYGRPWDVSSMLVVCFIELKIKVNVVDHVVIGLHCY